MWWKMIIYLRILLPSRAYRNCRKRKQVQRLTCSIVTDSDNTFIRQSTWPLWAQCKRTRIGIMCHALAMLWMLHISHICIIFIDVCTVYTSISSIQQQNIHGSMNISIAKSRQSNLNNTFSRNPLFIFSVNIPHWKWCSVMLFIWITMSVEYSIENVYIICKRNFSFPKCHQ